MGFQGGVTHISGSFEIDTGNDDSNIFYQTINQNGQKVGTATYTIGRRANDDYISRFNESLVNDDAELKDGSSDGRNEQNGIYTGAILARLDLDGNISLDVSESKTWAASLTGNGDVTYSGDSSTTDILDITRIFQSRDDVDRELYLEENTYIGSTTLENITANLNVKNAFGQTQSLTLTNAIVNANSTEALTNIYQDLTLDGNSRLILREDQNALTVGGNVTFKGVNLDEFGIQANQLNVTSSVVLDSSSGLYDVNTKANSFRVEGSNVEIASDTSVVVEETDVVSGASLKASIGQLGKNILISGIDEEGLKSTIRVTNDGNLNFDKDVLAASDGVLHFNLYSELAKENRGVLSFEENSGESGNSVLVRLSNATYTYESNDGFSSYVVGGNGEFIYAGNSTINLNTIGWQYTDENAQKTGVVNLVGYDFDVNANDPAIIAGEIYFSESHNELWIDQDDFTGVTGSTDRTNILALDRANQSRLLIAGQKSEDSPEEPTIILKDENGQDIESQESTYLDSSHGGNRAAKLDWSIGASYSDEDQNVAGIYLDYSVQTINLLNGSTTDVADTNSSLKFESALVATGEVGGTDNSLASRLSGHGILEFQNGNAENEKQVTISIANSSNNYSGATVVREQTKLQSTGSGLGDSMLVLIGEKADFELLASQVGTDTAINGITTDDAAHTITIRKGTTLTLAGNTLDQSDLDSLNSGYKSNLELDNVLGKNTQLSGEGNLVLVSNLVAKSALAFNDFAGSVTLSGDDEARTLRIGTGDEDTVLTNGVFVSEGKATHFIDLKSGAQIGKVNDVNGADFSGFNGTLVLGANKVFDIYEKEKLGDSDLQASAGSTLVMHAVERGESLLNEGTLTVRVGKGELVTLRASDSEASLDVSSVNFDNTEGRLLLDLDSSVVSLEADRKDIAGQFAANLGSDSALNLTGSGLNVDWANLTGEKGSTVFLTNSSTTDRTLTIKNIAEGFDGTSKFSGFDFTFGANSNPTHADLLAGHTFEFLNSNLTADGLSTVKNLTLGSGSSLTFIETDNIAIGEASSSLITVADGGTLDLGDAEIRIDTSKVSFDQTTDPDHSTTSESLLEALNTAQGEDKKYFQIVSGDATGGGKVTDLDGKELGPDYVVDVIGADGNEVAQIGGGATVIEDDGLWVGQGVQYMKLLDSMNLNADVIGKEDLTDGAFVVNARITSDESASNLTLTIDGETPIQLNGAGGAFYGTTKVADKGHLILGADNALGENGAALEVDQGGTLTVQNVDQAVRSMKVNGTLNLEKDSRLLFKKDAVAEIGADAVLDAEGTWDLSAGARMVIVAAEKGQKLTSGSVSGGTISKTGSGVLTLGHDVVDSHDVAIEVTEGSLNVEDWNSDEYLTLNSLTLAGASSDEFVEFDLAGNLNTSKGFTASNAKIWVGSRNYTADSGFADKVINGGYSGNATFVFNVQLGEDESFGDSLTINDGVADGSHADLFVNVVGKDKFAIKGLTLLKVEVDPEEGTAVSEDFASLAEGNTVEAGGYEWFLDSYIDGSYREWHLTNQLDQSNNQHETETIGVRLGSLSAFAASVDMFDMNIHDRQGTRPWINPVTGEKTMTSLWMRQTLSKESSSDSSGQLSGDAKENVTMIGGDILQLSPSGSGLVYAGLMAGYGGSDYDGSSNRVTDTTSADIEAWMVGAYAGWNQNDPKVDRSGAYVSGWVQYAHFKGDTMRTNSRTIEAKAEGIAASLEAGWVVKAAEFQMQGGETKGAFYVEPHAQVTWWGADYDNIEEESIRFEGQHNITTRLGARLTMETSGATNFSPYLEANWVHNTKDYGAVWNDAESYIEGAGNQAELKFGAETFFTDSFSGYAQIRANWGGDGYNRQEGSLGLKYRF